MIRAAARAGADYIKFQTFVPAELATPWTPKAEYQQKTTGGRESQRKMLERLCLSQDKFRLLQKECKKHGIGFLSTAFDPESLRFIESLRPDFHKISSGDIDNIPLLRQVARYKRPLILSTGMATMDEIRKAFKVITKAGLPRKKVTILQCHTDYPTQPEDSNLLVMDTLRIAFKVRAGLSDHTPGILVGLAAAARGACVIEKHFTLDRSMRGPDHCASLTAEELGIFVRGVHKISLCLGDGIKRPSLKERKVKQSVRRFLVAARTIRKGEKFSANNLVPKRTGRGVPAGRWDDWLQKKAGRNYRPEELICG